MSKATMNPLGTYGRPVFDYATLDDGMADQARQAVTKIRSLEKAASIDIGRELVAMKEALPHGQFLPWIEAEFSYSRRTAQNLMQVATAFGDKWETVAHLPPAILYQLAAPSTPDAVRQMATEVPAGRTIAPRELQEAIRKARPKPVKSGPSPEEQARQAKVEARIAADSRRRDRENAEAQARAGQAVAFLQEQLGPDLFGDFLAMVREGDHMRIADALRRAAQR